MSTNLVLKDLYLELKKWSAGQTGYTDQNIKVGTDRNMVFFNYLRLSYIK